VDGDTKAALVATSRRWGLKVDRRPSTAASLKSGSATKCTPRKQRPQFAPSLTVSCRHALDLEVVNVGRVQEFIDMGRLRPSGTALITMKDLLDAGVVSSIKQGVKLLGRVGFCLLVHCVQCN
jgi:hypothetical protein